MMKLITKLLVVAALFFPFFAHAVGEPYTQEKLDNLNNAGKPALVFIYADWCPTCRAQEKILNSLLPTDEFKGITTLRVNFDKQKAVVKAFGAMYQSTLIVFKGGREVARVTGDTDPDRIAALLHKAL
jgi:thioredoxin 1